MLQDSLNAERIKTSTAENARVNALKDVQNLENQLRGHKNILADKEDEIRNLQINYEKKLAEKDEAKIDSMSKNNQIIDKLNFEIEYLKKELGDHVKQIVSLKQDNLKNQRAAPMMD